MKAFDEMVAVMHRLRHECPWDKEQTLTTLRKYLIEEAYECLAAMNDYLDSPTEANLANLVEELGDVQLQVLFQAELLTEITQTPALERLLLQLKEKLIRRHPHVFKPAEADPKRSAVEVYQQWNEIKASEKPKVASLLGEIPKDFTALMRAQKLGDKAKKIKFDWNHKEEVWKQVLSEQAELEKAQTASEKEEELGDLLFSLVQWARHEGIDAETALAKANQKFERRCEVMFSEATKTGVPFTDLSLKQMEDLWQRAKKELNRDK